MATEKSDIWVYVQWRGMLQPKCIGILSAHQAKGRKAFSFSYDADWLQSNEQFLLDPDMGWYTGSQFPEGKENFGVFLDSMPDRWGRTLMKRRAAQMAKISGESVPNLYEVDFLLGVDDESRMGALRFKTDPEGPFLSHTSDMPIPPVSSIRELQFAANMIESDTENEEVRHWLAILLAPGSSLGGARPKANVKDEHGQLWIAKFPSRNDEVNKATWEYLLYKLALKAGINMANSRLLKVQGNHHTFLTQRFDRDQKERIHFASAMTMTGNNEETIKDAPASYLDLAEFLQFSGAKPQEDLHQLWRRIIFNISVSNTDDHLRNHGFLLANEGWRLSPAYDLNPSIERDHLSLLIDSESSELDLELARSVGTFFQLNSEQMDAIISEVQQAVSSWQEIAKGLKIVRKEQEIMAAAFKYM